MAFDPKLTHAIGGNTAGATANITTGTYQLNGGNNITLSQNGNSVTISGPNTVAQTAFVFSNSNGVSFGTNGSTVTATVATNYQSQGAYLTTAAQSNQVVNSVNGSTGQISFNIGSSLSSSTNGSSITFGLASNITTALQSAGNYLTSQSNQAFSAPNGSSTFQTLSFANSNGITFSNSNGSVVASHNGLTTARASNDGVGLNTAQSNVTWTVNSSGISLDGRNYAGTGTTFNGANVSGSITQNSNGLQLSLSAAAGGGGADGYNIVAAGTQTAATTGTIMFSNSNGITFGMSNSSIVTASHNGITQQSTQPVAISGSNGSFQFSTATFGNLNGLSFYTSNGSMVGSYTVPTVTNSSFSVQDSATTINPINRIAFSTGNNITLSLSTGASSVTVGVQHNLAGTSTGFGGNLISGSMTNNSSGLNLSLNHPAWLTTAMQSNAATISNIRVSAGTTSNLLSAITFSNSNGISFGINGSTMTASHNGLTTAAQSDHSHGNPTLNLTNLSGTTASNSAGFTLSLSAAAGGGGVTPVASASNGSFSFTTLNFSNANNVTFGTSAGSIITASVAAPGAAAENNWVNLLGANTSGNTTASGSTLGYSGINLTLSGTNGSVVNISAPATSSIVGASGISISSNGSTYSIGRVLQSEYVPFIAMSTNSQTLAVLGATSASARFFPMDLSDNIAFNVLSVMHNLSYATSSVAGSQTVTYLYGLYTNNGESLSLISSSSFSLAVTNSSVSNTVSYPVSTGTAGYTYTTLAQTTTANIQSFWGTAAAGRPIGLQFGNTMSLSSGDYWLGLLLRHSSSSANIGISIAVNGNANAVYNNLAGIGQASSAQTTNYSIRYGQRGLGAYTVSQSTLPNGVPISQIAMTQTVMPLYSFLST